ncbi:MAG: ABC transporter ATP-binding protein [Candidatus Eremiobacter antarcticus]|nr:ABC transporter ATP-binding protein [Candidatus Eremiobacteraeota bacterium]MBC5807700.1 ABC transporter ATP-binding protein [Candidatus Eremiobacteraeota bacterium]PZR60538.1 MAG: ABC transporter ATP-binding protein [Candidatus Eremiobacter sp. RRmetagenome_bin22]
MSMQHAYLLYGKKTVLSDCSLDCKRGEVTCVIGLSGAGKSTILRLINGLRRPQGGHIYVNGSDIVGLPERDLIEVRKKMGFAFQGAALFDSLTVTENVSYPLYEHTKLSPDEIEKRVDDTLESLGLSDVADRLPAELSGGMQKRVGFARAIVNEPEIILFDEPTTGLDPIMTNVITDTIRTIQSKLHATSVVVMHDMPSVYAIADNIAMLFEGTIIASGPAKDFRRSQNPIIQQFLQGSEVGPIPL